MAIYNVNDWYWQVGGNTSQVWSSSRFAYVAPTDDFYQVWLQNGNLLIQIDTVASLGEVMATQRIPSYLGNGLAIVSTGNSAVNSTYALDDLSVMQLGTLARDIACNFGLPVGLQEIGYPDINSNIFVFTPTSLTNLYLAVRDYVAGVNISVSTLVRGGASTLPTQPVTIP